MHPDEEFERGVYESENDIERKISGLDQGEKRKRWKEVAVKRRH